MTDIAKNINTSLELSTEALLAEGLAHELRALKVTTRAPQTLEELQTISQLLSTLIPELGHYDLTTTDGRREFPRTAASLAILGGLLRAADALNLLDSLSTTDNPRRVAAAQALAEEWDAFSKPQDPSLKLSLDEFTKLARLFKPLTLDAPAALATALSLVYGDLCKMPDITKALHQRFLGDTADHDIALQQALHPDNVSTCSDLFPTLASCSPELRRQVQIEVTHGVNLGHIIQAETCAAALSRLEDLAGSNTQILRNWFLSAVLDILGARADEKNPASWAGSVLGNRNLIPALLTFAEHLPTLASTGREAFFDTFQSAVAKRPFYSAIVNDSILPDTEKAALFRLARFLSWETDNRPVGTLVEAWKCLPQGKRNLLVNYFMNPGSDPQNPKPIVTYLPYVFTQMYAKHFPLPEALSRSLDTITDLLERISEHETNVTSHIGVRTYSAQGIWFGKLRGMSKAELEEQSLKLAVTEQAGRTPEVIPESQLLGRNPALLAPTLQALQAAADAAFPLCATILNARLTQTERDILSFVNSQPLSAGSWYRPIHNLIVTMSMIRICESTNANRDLVLAAILHDVGYSAVEIPGTLQGAAWDTQDARVAHMAAGRQMSEEHLRRLMDEGQLRLDDDRLTKILDIIATHDNPYLGKPLSGSEALLHRDADRLFVLSCTSFWKDYVAFLSDSGQREKFTREQIEPTPENFLQMRQASFVQDVSNSKSHLTTFEPMVSDFAKEAVEQQLADRRAEIAAVLSYVREESSVQSHLEAFLTHAIVTEFERLAH
jgi:hypothetical protein